MGKAEIKKELENLVQDLPENAQWEDVMYKIYVRQSIEQGLKDSRAGRSLTHEEIKKKYQLSK
jgi:predicted transcriptional regulator